jgi:hypothetical protein
MKWSCGSEVSARALEWEWIYWGTEPDLGLGVKGNVVKLNNRDRNVTRMKSSWFS